MLPASNARSPSRAVGAASKARIGAGLAVLGLISLAPRSARRI
ncbi:hypothetical protein SAMN05216360_10131 [Methylobacterium phyllostachyos]|uniref:Uncharacterized protein n=1 Tax=Methylobacterium phyllostachyos TaxID=582672 RepID=A0A1G9R178_9HYPH|nr:hypothetical protein SAMN05216360_10131 [Methylobacterium phyllostachyos]